MRQTQTTLKKSSGLGGRAIVYWDQIEDKESGKHQLRKGEHSMNQQRLSWQTIGLALALVFLVGCASQAPAVEICQGSNTGSIYVPL